MVKLEFKTCVLYDTEQPADSVEWCPHDGWRNILTCGTYQLDRDEAMSSARRKGRILLYRYDIEAANILTLLQTIERMAVLDQKWNPVDTDRLAVAGADGMIALYKLDASELPQLELQTSVTLRGIETETRNVLALSIEWSFDGKRLISSDSHGCVEIFTFENEVLRTVHNWRAHGFEAWTCAFSRFNENVVFSGGDDCILCVYDIRCPDEPYMKFKNKTHSAGVTSLLSLPHRDHALLTGSYDENIRLFDERQLKYSITEYGLIGGVWRLKSNPRKNPERILCACMYHNFSVVELLVNDTFQLTGEYSEHESICYGCDWRCQENETNQEQRSVIATCSFYDHKLCVSEISEHS